MNTYIQLRMFFQSRKNDLNIRELRRLKKDVKDISKLQVFKFEQDDCEDLIMDIDIFIESIIAKKKAQRDFDRKREEERLKHFEGKTLRQIEMLENAKDVKLETENFLSINSEDFLDGNLMERVEKNLYRKTLHYFDGNRNQTAKALGVSVRTLRNRINDWKREDGNQPWLELSFTAINYQPAKVAQNSMRF